MTDKIQYRTITLDTRNADGDKRTVPATLSSEQPVQRAFGMEVLSHTKGAVNLERAINGLPLLFSHNADEPVGRAENIRISGRKLKADLRFSKSARGSEIWQDVQDGVLTDISIGYRIDDYQETDETLTVTRWTIFETSVVTISADTAAGINRSLKMDKDKTTEPGDDSNVVAHTRWLKQEKRRRNEVRQLFELHTRHEGITDLMNECLDDPAITGDRASKLLLDELGKQNADPIGGDFRQSGNGDSLSQRDTQDVGHRAFGNFTARDTLSEFAAAAVDGTLLRAGAKIEKPHPGAVDTRNMRMSDIGEVVLRQFGVRTQGLSRDQVIRKALSTRGLISHSTSDFTNILENISEKSLLIGFQEIGGNYRGICRIGSLPDFKQGSRVALSDFDDLEIVYENGEYKVGSYTDTGVKLQLQTYGKLFNISRQALINDDLNSFIGIPRGMGAAAVRAVDDACFNVLTSNPTMGDGDTLFHSNHSNDAPNGSGAAPSVSTIDAAFTAMTTQTGPGGAHLNITPRLLIVPQALATTSRVIANSINDPSSSVLATPNPFAGEIEVVSDARLDSDDAARWYMAASPGAYDTVECAFLDGMEQPFLETRDGWTQDGAEFKARIDFTCAALDYRGLYRNDGN